MPGLAFARCRRTVAALAACVGIAAAGPAPRGFAEEAGGGLRATYVANEGFLLEGGGRKVLVDALFGEYPDYIDLDAELRARVVAGAPPFDDVDLVLATHHHADHFDPGAVARFLAAQPDAVFVSTPQAVALLADQPGFEKIRDRVRAVYPQEGKREKLPELGLEVLNLHHGRQRRPPVENLGFVVQLGGFQVLHVGDTVVTRAELEATGLADDGIDLAMVPDWLLVYDDWAGMIESVVRPRHLAAIHLRADAGKEDYERIRKAAPAAVLFRVALEVRTFPPD